jgi:hypothetical protein
MLKCGDKFCSDSEIKDAENCRRSKLKNNPTWKGACFYRRDGQDGEECGGRVIRTNGCYECVECGYSPCG